MVDYSAFRLITAGFAVVSLFVCQIEIVSAQGRDRNSLSAIQESHRQRFDEYSTQIDKLHQFCKDKKLDEAAKIVAGRNIPPDLESRSLTALPKEVLPQLPAQMNPDERYWQTQLRSIEKEYSKDLYLLSRRALHAGYPGYAFGLVRETALHDPDHANARKILGFVRNRDEWVTQFAYSQIKEGNVWHTEFGWLPKSHLDRYVKGERYYRNKWITAEKELESRRDFEHAWEIRTDHYLIKTNVSRERGVQLGRALEDFHEFFFEMFAGFFNTPEQMEKLFKGTSSDAPVTPSPYLIHYYRTREEYNDRLRKDFPNIEMTNGVYMTTTRIAHFYEDPNNNNEATLFHEASHQLFFESGKLNRPIGDKANFWIIEGIACYMESFQRKNGGNSIGDPNYIRFAGARMNLLENKYYVPLQRFSMMGMQEFQQDPDLAKNYTQSSGLARFFMEYDNGRYREALVKHLSQLYSGNSKIRAAAVGLDKLTGVSYEELDRQYAEETVKTEKTIAGR